MNTHDKMLDYQNCASMPRLTYSRFWNVDEQAARLSGHDQAYQQLSAGRFDGAFLTVIDRGSEWLYLEETNQALIQQGATPSGSISFLFLLHEQSRCRLQDAEFQSHDLAVMPPGDEFYGVCEAGAGFCVITLSEQDVASLVGEFAFQGVQFLQSSSMPYVVQALRMLVRTSISLSDCELGHFASESTLSNLRSSVVATLGLAISTAQDTRRPIPSGVFAEACKLIKADLPEISVSRLLRELEISRRSLETVFREKIGMGPSTYIKVLRLNEIRRELLSSDNHCTIADIASKWGIWHPSNFSASYRNFFGELPSITKNLPD